MGRLMLMLDRHTALRARTMRALAANTDVFARLLAIHVGATAPLYLVTTETLFGWRFVAV